MGKNVAEPEAKEAGVEDTGPVMEDQPLDTPSNDPPVEARKPPKRRVRKFFAVLIMALLLGQTTLVVAGFFDKAYGESFSGVHLTDYGVPLAIQEIVSEMETKQAEPGPAVQENLSYYRTIYANKATEPTYFQDMTAEAALKDETALVADVPMDLSQEMEEYTLDTNHQGYEVRQVDPIPSVKAEIFEWMLTNPEVNNQTLFETLASLLTDTYLIYTKYDGEVQVTSANLIDTLAGASTGLLTEIVEENVPWPLNQALLLFISQLDESEISWVEIDVDDDPANDIKVRLVPILREFLNVTVNLQGGYVSWDSMAGASIQIHKLDGVEAPDELEVAVMRTIGYPGDDGSNDNYIWTVGHTFSNLADEYEWDILASNVSFTLSADAITNPGANNFTSFDPPYTIQYYQQFNTPTDPGMDWLEMLPGYAKFEWSQGDPPEEALSDLTFIKVLFDNPNPGRYIPQDVIVRIKGDEIGQSRYDSIEWYASTRGMGVEDEQDRPNVDVVYYEEKENPAKTMPFHSYIIAEVEGLPIGDLNIANHRLSSLYLEVKNQSSDTRPKWTVVDLEANTRRGDGSRVMGEYAIRSIRYWDFEYYSEDRDIPATFNDHHYHRYLYLEAHHIPARLHLEGSFWIGGTGDPVTLFDQPGLDIVSQFIDNLLLRIASKLYAIGLTLRGIPEAVLGVSATGGRFLITLRKSNGTPDYLGSTFLYLTSDRYLYLPGTDDYFAIYNQSAFFETNAPDMRSQVSDNYTELGVSARLTGIGDVYYESEDVNRTVSLVTAPDRAAPAEERPLRIFFQNNDAELEPTNWANITLSGLPQNIELTFNATTFRYVAEGGAETGVIDNITFRAYSKPTYTSFDLDHLPAELSITRTGELLYLDSPGAEGYFDFRFAISNITFNDTVTMYQWHANYTGSYALLYQTNMTRYNERTAVSGRLLGISAIRLKTASDQSLFFWRLKESVPFRVGIYDPTQYEDPSLGLNAYIEIAALPETITVTIPPVDTTSIPKTEVGNISSLTEIARLVDQLASLGNTLVDLVSDLSLNLVSSVGGFEAGAQFTYNLDKPLDIVGWVDKGDVNQLDPPRWVHGIWVREMVVPEGTILAARVLLRGLPKVIDLDFEKVADRVTANLYFNGLSPDHANDLDYLLVDLKGVQDLNVTLYVPQLVNNLEMEAHVDLVANTSVENLTLQGSFSFESYVNKAPVKIGGIYLEVEETNDAYQVRTMLSNLPSKANMDLDISSNASLVFDAADHVDFMLAQVEMGDTSDLVSYWVHGLSAEVDEAKGAISAKAYVEGLPTYAELHLTQDAQGTNLDLDTEEFHTVGPEAPDYLIVDIRNLSQLDVLLYLGELPNSISLDVHLHLKSESATAQRDLQGTLNLTLNQELGPVYARIIQRDDSSATLEAVVPNVPQTLGLNVHITEGVDLDFDCLTPLHWAMVSIDLGDTSKLGAYWTHGLVIRQGDPVANGTQPIAVRLFLTGVPTQAHLDADFTTKSIIHLSLLNFSPEVYEWAVVDVDGFGSVAFLLYVSYIPKGTTIDATFDIDADEQYWVKDYFEIGNTKKLGATYLKTFNHTKPSTVEVYLSEVTRNLEADLLSGHSVDLTVKGDDPVEIIWINLAKKTYGQWRNIHATVHDVPDFFRFIIEPNYQFDMHESFVFQGFPSVEVQTSSNDIDVYLNIDRGYTGGFTGTRLHAVNAGDDTKLYVDYRSGTPVFKIEAPNKLGQAFYRVDGAPSTKQFYMDYLELHARDVSYVTIEAKLLFNAYPIFVLENAEGGDLLFGLSGTMTLMGIDLEVNAVILDIRMKEVGDKPVIPSWSSAQVNGGTTSLGSGERHYIVPEPIGSFIGSIGGTLLG